MADVTILRDPFHLFGWHVYLPLVKSRGEYIRVDLEVPRFASAQDKYIAIGQIFHGFVHPGKVLSAQTSSCDWIESAYWGNDSGGNYYYRKNTIQGSYLEVVIPSGHNRITLLSKDVTGDNGANLAIGWYDADGNALSNDDLLVTTYDSGVGATTVKEVVLATDAKSDGVKRLRVTMDDTTGTARIIGFRCWNTHAVGDPSTESAVAGQSLGHDMIDITQNGDGYYREEVAGSDAKLLTVRGTSFESAINWKPTSQSTAKWSGGWYHAVSPDAPYTYHGSSGYLTNGAAVFVDGTAINGTTQMARNEIHSGESVIIRSEGYYDYALNGTEDAGDPAVVQCLSVSPQGLAFSAMVKWTDATTVTSAYSPMINFSTAFAAGLKCKNLPINDETILGDSDVTLTGYGGSEIICQIKDLVIRMDSVGAVDSFYWVDSTKKAYMKYNLASLPGGATPASGDTWIIGGRLEFRKQVWTPKIMRYRRIGLTGHPMKRQWP